VIADRDDINLSLAILERARFVGLVKVFALELSSHFMSSITRCCALADIPQMIGFLICNAPIDLCQH